MGNRIEASICHNLSFHPIVLLSGVIRTASTIGELEREMPRSVDSLEQGIAWVTWILDEHRVLATPGPLPSWVEQGRANVGLLPWIKRRRAYEASPKCLVRRDYARLALKELAEAIAEADADETVRLEFDGEVLRMRIRDRAIVMPARGEPWPEFFELPADGMRSLPRRLSGDPVFFGVWDGAFTLDNRRYPGVVLVPRSAE